MRTGRRDPPKIFLLLTYQKGIFLLSGNFSRETPAQGDGLRRFRYPGAMPSPILRQGGLPRPRARSLAMGAFGHDRRRG